MPVYPITDKSAIAPLFAGWQETMIWSCLQDCMGVAYADDLKRPQSAQIVVGPLGFFAGAPNDGLIRNNLEHSFDLVPQNPQWESAIEQVYGGKVNRYMRFATKKEKDTFDRAGLQKIVSALPEAYRLNAIDHALYAQVMASGWAVDLCSNFGSGDDYVKNGLGFVVMQGDEIMSGASSFTYYRGGIEIEIDTRKDMRRKGLALACGARLILECLDRGLYPSWDAHNRGSLALAEKLGYHFDREYPTYTFA
ncbi:MAG: GNAT family N-acetyltransferase [Ruminococcaceae bacterium]|nr:GNAT family N-acetyltransferase [Oscillospiraceae bacterium]